MDPDLRLPQAMIWPARRPWRWARPSAPILLATIASGCAADVPMTTRDVGEAEACQDVASWPVDATEAEGDLFLAINGVRARGGRCGEADSPPSLELTMSPPLRCAARLHARDMAEHARLSHEGSDGSLAVERAALAGYDDVARYELIALDHDTVGGVLQAWLEDPANCAALLEPDLDHAGPGSYQDPDSGVVAWVLLLGAEKSP